MFTIPTVSGLAVAFLLIASVPNAESYTKYGRTCKDIGCKSDEVCVLAEDPCSIYQRDNCGSYPTCRKANSGPSCTSMVCGENEYCKTENGAPKCVRRTTGNGYESAGVSYVNGHRVIDDTADKSSPSNSNTNPYANANAPPLDPVQSGTGYHVNTGSNLGYPAYPSSSNNNNGYPPYPSTSNNHGYPPYPSSNHENRMHNLGYPPYPTHDRMPVPGYPAQGSYPPAQGYPQYPAQQGYPYPAYPKQNSIYTQNSVYRRNNAAIPGSSLIIVCVMCLVGIFGNRS